MVKKAKKVEDLTDLEKIEKGFEDYIAPTEATTPTIKELYLIKDLNITSSFASSNVLFGSQCELTELSNGDVNCRIASKQGLLIVIKSNNIAAIAYED